MTLLGPEEILNQLDEKERRSVEWLLCRETELLDERRYDEWLELFTEDCLYWMPVTPEQTDYQDHVSLFREDRALMAMRIARISHPAAHSLANPLRTNHVTGPVTLKTVDLEGGSVMAVMRFQLTEFQDERRRHFAGLFTYDLLRTDGGYRIRTKRVDLIDCDAPFEPLETFI